MVKKTQHGTIYCKHCKNTGAKIFSTLFPSPECCVDLQGFAKHLGSNVIHVISTQVHFSKAGVAA